jgi:hypothetical protein
MEKKKGYFKMKIKEGTRRKMKCKATKRVVTMEYVGKLGGETGEFNGHKNWLCLHRGY